jgi:histidyl-tRNA synthetase
MKNNIVTPKKLKGFNDFFGEDMRLREYVINVFKKNFEKYGYEPLETPSLEYTELLLGISGSEAEKLFYRFQDPGGRDVMLKYEVMTSMCRAVAENYREIQFPYKRYQIQRVWRSENVQNGRYREFTQCDADTLGSNSMQCDAEFIQMGLEVVKDLGFQKTVARISDRKFVDGLAQYLGLPADMFYAFFVSIDKLAKIGKEGVVSEMVAKGIEKDLAEKGLDLILPENFEGKNFQETIEILRKTVGTTVLGGEALNELSDINKYLNLSGVSEDLYRFDTSLARGLASYTGPVWEFDVKDGGVGSIAGCGRYDNVIEKYIGIPIPATGGSFGIERMCDIIKSRNMMNFENSSTRVLITLFNEDLMSNSLEAARVIREHGINAMLYPDFDSLKKQFTYADRKKIRWAIVIGPDEATQGKVNLKDLEKKEQKSVTIAEAIELMS